MSNEIIQKYEKYADACIKADTIDKQSYIDYGVNRGLRDINGKGVLCGLTNISTIEAYKTENGVKVPCDGKLNYRGYNINDLVNSIPKDSFGFEETAYLLLMGDLPNEGELSEFKKVACVASQTAHQLYP